MHVVVRHVQGGRHCPERADDRKNRQPEARLDQGVALQPAHRGHGTLGYSSCMIFSDLPSPAEA